MGWIDRIDACNRWNINDYGHFYDHKGRLLGRPKKDFIDILAGYQDVFSVQKDHHVTLNKNLSHFDERTKAVRSVILDIRHRYNLFPLWRGEEWRAAIRFDEPPEFNVERGAIAHFGFKAWGVHVNGYVQKDDGLYLWVAKRSPHKLAWPSKWDQIVGGGQPAYLSPLENVIKESGEEAGIPENIAKKSKPVGTISYTVDWEGLHRDDMFVFDLELPLNFVPEPVDGEVESFTLMPIMQVAKIVQNSQDFKDNSALVVIDFLIRHDLLTAKDPDYPKIIAALHKSER